MNGWHLIMLYIAMALHFASAALWIPRWKDVPLYFYVCVIVGMVCISARHIALLDQDAKTASALSTLVSGVLLTTVLFHRRAVMRSRKLFSEMENEKKSLALRLTEVLVQHKSQIDFYEKQAKHHNLPLFTESGQDGGTRTHDNLLPKQGP